MAAENAVLTTSRLRLRPWRDKDLEPYAALNADARVREFFPGTMTADESAASMRHIREHFARHGFGLWAAEEIGGAPFIGFIGLAIPVFDAHFMPCVEVGYRLAFDHWSRGYATEGARAALEFGFESAGLDEIVSMTTVTNVRSRRVMTKLGMTHNPADDSTTRIWRTAIRSVVTCCTVCAPLSGLRTQRLRCDLGLGIWDWLGFACTRFARRPTKRLGRVQLTGFREPQRGSVTSNPESQVPNPFPTRRKRCPAVD